MSDKTQDIFRIYNEGEETKIELSSDYSRAEIVGLLEFAKLHIINQNKKEDTNELQLGADERTGTGSTYCNRSDEV